MERKAVGLGSCKPAFWGSWRPRRETWTLGVELDRFGVFVGEMLSCKQIWIELELRRGIGSRITDHMTNETKINKFRKDILQGPILQYSDSCRCFQNMAYL